MALEFVGVVPVPVHTGKLPVVHNTIDGSTPTPSTHPEAQSFQQTVTQVDNREGGDYLGLRRQRAVPAPVGRRAEVVRLQDPVQRARRAVQRYDFQGLT